jgi:hypothetical protein
MEGLTGSTIAGKIGEFPVQCVSMLILLKDQILPGWLNLAIFGTVPSFPSEL